MKNSQLQKTDYTGQIEAASEVIRQAQGNRAMRSPAPETFVLHCFCAVHDKPYTLHFIRQPSGLLRFSASIKGQASNSRDNARAGGVGYTMRLGLFEKQATPCAWCGNGSFHHCAYDCGALVCGGRMRGNTFHCRPNCGAEWVGVPLQAVKGSVQDKPRMPHVKEPLRLSAGTALVPTGRK